MSENSGTTGLTPVARPRPAGFAKGHPRFGGRQKGAANKLPFDAISTARRLKFDPIETMIQVVQHGSIIEADGTATPVEMPDRMRTLREVAPYLVSKAPTEIKGEVEHKHSMGVDISMIMGDPKLAAAAEHLALALLEQEQQDLAAPEAAFEVLSDEDSPAE